MKQGQIQLAGILLSCFKTFSKMPHRFKNFCKQSFKYYYYIMYMVYLNLKVNHIKQVEWYQEWDHTQCYHLKGNSKLLVMKSFDKSLLIQNLYNSTKWRHYTSIKWGIQARDLSIVSSSNILGKTTCPLQYHNL